MSEQAIKKILITGANGFIGGSLMRYYQNHGQDVVGVDLIGNGNDIVEGDVSQPNTISQQLQECDVIIHTAALVSNAMQDSDMWQVNVLATRNLIQAAKEHKVRRFVQISSIVAYGNSAEGELDAADQAFTRVIEQYNGSTKVPDALYKLGLVKARKGEAERSRELLEQVRDDYPQSSAAGLANDFLRQSAG